jgi:hypothetical protein
VQEVKEAVSNAVKGMQASLRLELHESELQVFRELGSGAFGTVYHGARRRWRSRICLLRCFANK